jgi:ankyrin repeat protein
MATKWDVFLCAAVKHGNIKGAKKALKNGADINYDDGLKFHVLILAAAYQHKEMVLFLLENGAVIEDDFFKKYTFTGELYDIIRNSMRKRKLKLLDKQLNSL